MKHLIIPILALNTFAILWHPQNEKMCDYIQVVDTLYLPLQDTTPLTECNVLSFIKECGIEHPNVVYAQMVAETNHLKSEICKESNNLFGFKVEPSNRYEHTYHIKGIKNRSHLVFPSWKYSVMHYKAFQDVNYKGGDYYEFLERQGYAEDQGYIKLLKSIKQ